MFTTLLLILLILDSFVLVAGILLQAGKGSGMAASFGGVSSSPDAFIGTRQAGNLLTKITWWSGGIFLAIAFVLQVASARSRAPKSVLEQGLTPPAPVAPAPTSSAPALPFLPGQTTPAPAGAGPPNAAGSAPAKPSAPQPSTTKPAPATPAPSPK
jgi:preprotein translocase subunit SecG